MKYLFSITCIFILHTKMQGENPGDYLFDEGRIIEIRIAFSNPNYWDSLLATHHTETYYKGNIIIDGNALNDVGFRLKGQSSFQIPSNKKSIKIDLDVFTAEQNFDDLDKFNLNNGFSDPTFMREKIFTDVCHALQMPAPRINYANVYINDQLFGLYLLVEEIDKTFLKTHFSDNDGNLYKGDPHGDLFYYGENKSDYKSYYQIHTNKTESDWQDLIQLIKNINLSVDSKFAFAIDAALNIEIFYRYWAMHNIFSSLDSYIGNPHNYYLYANPIDQLFYFIPWDCNESFGAFNFETGNPFYQYKLHPDYLPLLGGEKPLVERCLANSEMKKLYYAEINIILEDYFNPSYLNAKIDLLADLIRPFVIADTMKMYSDSEFEINLDSNITVDSAIGGARIPGLKQFISERNIYLNEYLDSIDFVPTSIINNFADGQEKIIVAPTILENGSQLYFSSLPNTKVTMKLYNLQGEIISEQKNLRQKSFQINVIYSGLYFVELSDETKIYAKEKIIVN